MKPSKDIKRLVEIMAALRDRKNGCPWDIEQTFESIIPYTIEEAYEVADAISRNDRGDLCDELGDLLLQVIFHARIAEEEGSFDFGDVVNAVSTKMLRRHPHVFGDQKTSDSQTVKAIWTEIKNQEKLERRLKREQLGLPDDSPKGHLRSVKTAVPVQNEAIALQKKAAEVGFDWSTPEPIFDKLSEEMAELIDAIKSNKQADIEAEFGDLYFVMMNLARHLSIEPDKALARTNQKFRNRFLYIENELSHQGRSLGNATLDEMEELWQKAKFKE